ncbi:membrane protein [Cutibacterium acnes JCM 18909]|nr:membrane protein [Cutibacterium acnes JCM 18909]
MISLAIGLALAISIAIGRVRKINIGLVAIPFAYIIGAFFMHMKPSAVIDLWPTHIFFVIFAISLFFRICDGQRHARGDRQRVAL